MLCCYYCLLWQKSAGLSVWWNGNFLLIKAVTITIILRQYNGAVGVLVSMRNDQNGRGNKSSAEESKEKGKYFVKIDVRVSLFIVFSWVFSEKMCSTVYDSKSIFKIFCNLFVCFVYAVVITSKYLQMKYNVTCSWFLYFCYIILDIFCYISK